MSAEKQQKAAPGKPFEKGQSGNPKGRPKLAFSVSDKTREYLLAPDPDDQEGRSRLEVMQGVAYKAACSGDMRAFEQLNNRAFGKVADNVNFNDLTKRERPEGIVDLARSLGAGTSVSGPTRSES